MEKTWTQVNCNKLWDVTGVMGSKTASWGRLSLSWILKKATEVFKWALQDHVCVFKRSHWCNVKVENRVREETENDSGDWIRGRSLSKHLLKGRTRFFFISLERSGGHILSFVCFLLSLESFTTLTGWSWHCERIVLLVDKRELKFGERRREGGEFDLLNSHYAT